VLFCAYCERLRWRSWLRHRATSQKVADSIPHGVTETFYSGRTVALGWTQLPTEMMERGIKGGRYVGPTTLPNSCADCLKIWEPKRPGTLRACPGPCRDCLTSTFTWFESQLYPSQSWLRYLVTFLACPVKCRGIIAFRTPSLPSIPFPMYHRWVILFDTVWA
jgi:hypothetical protein